jgi:uncharacterized protein
MARIDVLDEDVTVDGATMVEGFPGAGLVGKIAADHLVEAFGMVHYANVHCEGVPPVATYAEGDRALRTPVRLYADEERGLLVLQSDVPVAPGAAAEVADCLWGWFAAEAVLPIYLSGLPVGEKSTPPALFGVGIGAGLDRLDAVDAGAPPEAGLVSGPTGALMSYALEHDAPAVGLVVETDPRFPDPEGARRLLVDGIGPMTGVDVPVDELVDRAEEIREARERLARRMRESDEESTRARPLRMYQ